MFSWKVQLSQIVGAFEPEHQGVPYNINPLKVIVISMYLVEGMKFWQKGPKFIALLEFLYSILSVCMHYTPISTICAQL